MTDAEKRYNDLIEKIDSHHNELMSRFDTLAHDLQQVKTSQRAQTKDINEIQDDVDDDGGKPEELTIDVTDPDDEEDDF